jgi:hypothetical protein
MRTPLSVDALEPGPRLTIYEQGAADGSIGDIWSPRIEPADSVRLECERLVAAVRSAAPRSTAQRAVSVVRVLESIEASLGRHRRVSQPIQRVPAARLELVPLRPPA